MERVAKGNHRDCGETEDKSPLRVLNDNTYNYRRFYCKYPDTKAMITLWPDEFKTAWRPTFSEESRYSGKKSENNPTEA